ncbi:MAG TPA: pyridoxal-dependent decarboxylase [Candidatus Limnocylindrales bacterium]|nr:pyridoxal-dependent decarboxylase [Candidatus Limnocylindrales bacterium]
MVAETQPAPQLAEVLGQLRRRLATHRRRDIGYPGGRDLDFGELSDLLCGELLNNVGDPYDIHGHAHTKQIEQQVIDIVGDWLDAPPSRWGYVTTGSSEGTLHALDEAWQAWHDVVVYTSTAAHYSVAKAARLLKLPLVMIATDEAGRMNTADLAAELGRRRHHPAIVVATAGTTMTEAIDDVAQISATMDRLAITRRRIHVDAALSGLPLALLPEADRPGFDFTAGATSMVVSGHKFLATLTPCAVLLYADAPHLITGRRIRYTASADTTITGSRSGHTPLLLWYSLTRLGADGHRRRAQAARNLAAYTHQRLLDLGWETRRNPHAFTVVLRSPPAAVHDNWILADDGAWAHIITMPGIDQSQIDDFLSDLEASRHGVPGEQRGQRRLPWKRKQAHLSPVGSAVGAADP